MSGGGPSRIRNRKPPQDVARSHTSDIDDDEHLDIQNPVRDTYVASSVPSSLLPLQRNRSYVEKLFETEQINVAMIVLLTTLAFALRFYKINWPDQVVYVHILYPCRVS